MAAAVTTDAVIKCFSDSIKNRRTAETPYRHWLLSNMLPDQAAKEVITLPFHVPELGGVSGKRELHNQSRSYFSAKENADFPVCNAVAEALQSSAVVGLLARELGANLDGTYLRIEYAQDTDGFWLQPHTDLGVKKFTLLYYLTDETDQLDLGTDIYSDANTHALRYPAHFGSALIFIPGDNTWHGFERRTIKGVRKSLIVNYVTDEWRAREQLAYPDIPVRAA